MLRPNCSSLISLARKVTVGLRIRRLVASTIRIVLSGAACGLMGASTPSLSRSARAGFMSAVVRWSGLEGSGPARVTSKPDFAKTRAAIIPAGPLPATTMLVALSDITKLTPASFRPAFDPHHIGYRMRHGRLQRDRSPPAGRAFKQGSGAWFDGSGGIICLYSHRCCY